MLTRHRDAGNMALNITRYFRLCTAPTLKQNNTRYRSYRSRICLSIYLSICPEISTVDHTVVEIRRYFPMRQFRCLVVGARTSPTTRGVPLKKSYIICPFFCVIPGMPFFCIIFPFSVSYSLFLHHMPFFLCIICPFSCVSYALFLCIICPFSVSYCCIYLSKCVVCYQFLWLGRESSWLTCLPHYRTRCHTHMSLLINASPSLHCLGYTIRLRHPMVQHHCTPPRNHISWYKPSHATENK